MKGTSLKSEGRFGLATLSEIIGTTALDITGELVRKCRILVLAPQLLHLNPLRRTDEYI